MLRLAVIILATLACAATSHACLQEVACAPAFDEEIEAASRAIAAIRFVRGDASYVCTGSLIRDAANSGIPYLLTSHHCISTPEEAASAEIIWDERSATCGVSSSHSRSIRTYGADLLVSSAATDVALLRLHKLPPNRVFLTVETGPLPEGTETYRISHAEGRQQKYSEGIVRTAGPDCPSAPRSRFIYTAPTLGGVAIGSSGAPLLLRGLRVAGQLFGICGPVPGEHCATSNDTVDGSLAASWPLLAPYLDPPPATHRRAAGR